MPRNDWHGLSSDADHRSAGSHTPSVKGFIHHPRAVPLLEGGSLLGSLCPRPYPEDGALIYVRDIALPAIAADREWHWMIRMRNDAGCTLSSISLYDQPGNNRGFWLVPQCWIGQLFSKDLYS